MNNPFLNKVEGSEYFFLNQNCSINKAVIAKIPVDGIEEDIQGKCAGDIFSTKTIADYIKKYVNELNIDITGIKDNDLPKEVSRCLLGDNDVEKKTAEMITKKFGYRLGIILLTLKTALNENRQAREDWTDEHWRYFSSIKKIILVGGLANDIFGEKMKDYALDIFNMADCEPYEILLFPNATHLGVTGCKQLIKNNDKVNIIFDFGQTFMKRSIFVDNIERALPSVNSKYMECGTKEGAIQLHEHIINVIKDTFNEAKKYGEIGEELMISIANYTVAGRLNSIRGGYAKLSTLAYNYAKYLEDELYKLLNVKFKVTLIHDGTAVALNFREYDSALCLSVGTAFGLGCPDGWHNLK